jgi:hypothetical protein
MSSPGCALLHRPQAKESPTHTLEPVRFGGEEDGDTIHVVSARYFNDQGKDGNLAKARNRCVRSSGTPSSICRRHVGTQPVLCRFRCHPG